MKARGIIVNLYDYKENDLIISLLTDQGIVLPLIAKGVKSINSKRKHAIFLFNEIECSLLQLGKSYILKSISVVKNRQELSNNISLNSSIFYICEFISKYQENTEQITYKLLQDILENKNKYHNLVNIILVILEQHGHIVPSGKCSECGSDKNISYFSIQTGFICSNCTREEMIMEDLIAIYKNIMTKKYDELYLNPELLFKRFINELNQFGGFKINAFNYTNSKLANM